MGSYTANKRLYKPDVGEVGWGSLLNASIDIIDNIGELYHFRRKTAEADRWYVAGLNNATTLTTGAPTANVLRALPIIVPSRITLDRLAINVTTAVAGNARLGLYNDDGNLYPSSLIVDAGVVDTGTTGVKTLTISNTIEAGRLIWAVIVSNAAPTIRCLPIAACMPILGYDNTLGTDAGIGWSVAFTFGALPATFPAGAAAITEAPVPAIAFRISA